MTIASEEMAMTAGQGGSYPVAAQPAIARAEALDWQSIGHELNEQGSVMLPGVLSRKNVEHLPACITRMACFAAASSWYGMALGVASTSTSTIRCPISFKGFGLRSIAGSRLSRINGTWPWAWMFVIPLNTPITSNVAMTQASFVPLPCFSSMEKAITTAFTRIFMESRFFRYRWRSSFLSLKGTSPAANSCSLNSVRGCNRDRRWCHYGKVMA